MKSTRLVGSQYKVDVLRKSGDLEERSVTLCTICMATMSLLVILCFVY